MRNPNAKTRAMLKYDDELKSSRIERADIVQVIDALGNPQNAQLALPALPPFYTADDGPPTNNVPRQKKVDFQTPTPKESNEDRGARERKEIYDALKDGVAALTAATAAREAAAAAAAAGTSGDQRAPLSDKEFAEHCKKVSFA